MKELITVLFLICAQSLTFGQNFWYNEGYVKSCHGDGPTYYTTRTLNIYEHMDTESAISGSVPAGEAIMVTNSFFGSNGWWEICFEGKTGWVKKAFLSKNPPTQPKQSDSTPNNSNNYSTDNTDVGFAPFLAEVISNVNFRSAPSTSSNIIKRLPTGSQLYVFSKKDISGFYKVIDIQSGNIGWISKSLTKYSGEADVNYSGAFQSTGKTSNFNSEVVIRNKSSYSITLVVGSQTFYLSPNSNATKSISPGKSYYIATAPGVIPASGYQTFDSYQGYEWEFWVETSRY